MNKLYARILVGLILGAGIAAVDNFAFQGEVSPMVIVALLLVATATVGTLWGRRGLEAAPAVWIWLPLSHLVKHVFNLPDTMFPNTYSSILKLALFSFVVSAIGAGCGVGLHAAFGCGRRDDAQSSAEI